MAAMESARFKSSAVKYTLSLVSPQPDVCGSVVTNMDYGKMAKRIRILSNLWWEEDAPLWTEIATRRSRVRRIRGEQNK